MSVFQHDKRTKPKFYNNIIAFHIGNGNLLTVAHNLKLESKIIDTIAENHFQETIFNQCNATDKDLLTRCYELDQTRTIRKLISTDQTEIKLVKDLLNKVKYDTRWITEYKKGNCLPYLIIQFRTNLFFNDQTLTEQFEKTKVFHEPTIDVYTFLIELKLIKAFYSEDIALYKMEHINQDIINHIPKTHISFDTILPGKTLYCLQSSPSGTNLGRLLNEARVEGILDHHAIAVDKIGGNFIRKGFRYLIKGYFRFGSSGSPYFIYDEETNSFLVHAIQSEASPIQLSIKNDKNGNFQYINAIATPLANIEEELKHLMTL